MLYLVIVTTPQDGNKDHAALCQLCDLPDSSRCVQLDLVAVRLNTGAANA